MYSKRASRYISRQQIGAIFEQNQKITTIQEQKTLYKIDTYAQANVIPMKELKQFSKRPHLQK